MGIPESKFFSRTVLPAVLALLMLLGQPAGFCDDKAVQPNVQSETSKKVEPNPADILIVQLSSTADREKFDDLLKEVHGTVIKTMDFGPNLQMLVIQTEPGKADEVAKQFSKSKDVARVTRNQTYTVDDNAIDAGSFTTAGVGNKGLFIGKNRSFTGKIRSPWLPRNKSFFGGKGFRSLPPAAPPPPPPPDPQLSGMPDDPLFLQQWPAPFMSFVQARNSGAQYSTGVAIYFLDTGVQPPDFLPGEYSPLTQQRNFAGFNFSGAPEPLFDSGSHGTATSSVTIATDNQLGYSGMANLHFQRCNVTMCRVSTDGLNTSTYNIYSALNYLYLTPLPPGPVNISFGSAPPNTLNADPTFQQISLQLASKGFLVVVAAGNNGAFDSSPELYARRVAAIGQNGLLTNFSNFGNFPYAAPGSDVPIVTQSGAAFGTGTSYAAPLVCAAIVDVMGALPAATRTATNADLIIRQTATVNPQGYRIPNIHAAVKMAAGIP